MISSLNSNYGQVTGTFPLASGKTFVVAPSTSDNLGKLEDLYQPDEDGVIRLYTSIQAAHDYGVVDGRGDNVIVAPGGYDETLSLSKSATRYVGLGGRGAAFVEPQTAGATGCQVTGDDITFDNLGIAGESTAAYALNVKGASRFRAYRSKFEGAAGPQVLFDGTATSQAADALLEDCELAWGTQGVVFDDSLYGYPTQIAIKKCWFHDLTTNHLGVAADGLVKGLVHEGNIHDNAEDGTAPTDYILLSDNGNTGTIAGNYFSTATNASAVITIGTGLKYPTNYTEAGPSAARPA